MDWNVAAHSDTGLRRANNEDAVAVRRDLGVIVVADGMGGHAAGEVASQLAVETVADALETAGLPLADAESTRQALADAVRAANRVVFDTASRERRYQGMGTTVTALAVLPGSGRLCIAHVGDSRAYRMRGARLEQLTTDHTWVQEQVGLGRLTLEEARMHAAAALLTRAVGTMPHLEVDEVTTDIEPGDVLLVCSDGLTSVVPDHGIAEVLARPVSTAELATDLVDRANRAGGPDNITVVVVRID